MLLDPTPRPQSVPTISLAARRRNAAFGNLRSETLLRKLEPRIMFDGAALATAAEMLHHDAAIDHHTGVEKETHGREAAAHREHNQLLVLECGMTAQ